MTEHNRGVGTDGRGGGVAADVEAIFPLLPNQRALLLYRELHKPQDPGFLQVRFTLTGSLDADRFARSWSQVLHRHPGLRATINQRDEGDPLLVVWRSPSIPISVEDWRGVPRGEQVARLDQLLDSDRERGLDPAVAPVMRLTLARTEDDRYEVVWSCHHLFVDGWSSAVVLEDVVNLYRRAPAAPALDGSVGFREYMTWALGRDDDAAQRYWSGLLAGYQPPPPLNTFGAASEPGYGEYRILIDAATSHQIGDFVRAQNLTPNALAQGALALVLSALFESDDVVFGTTVAGRSAPIDGIERLVGYISNAVPIRMRIPRKDPVPDWLVAARNVQFAGQAHESASLGDIQAWSGVPGHLPLFETFLILENFPEMGTEVGSEIAISGFQSGLTTAYPLTIAVVPGEPWAILARYDTDRCSQEVATSIVEQFVVVMRALTSAPVRRVGDVATEVARGLPMPGREGVARQRRTAYRPPETPSEEFLVGVWGDVLDLSPIGVDDDFFDIGGHSVLAVMLMDRIEERTGRRLPLSTLISAPTISTQARLISNGSMSSAESSVVPVRSTGSLPPLFVVPGAGGSALAFRDLAELLSPDQPLFAFEPLGHDGATAPHESIEAMAKRYVADMREVQPQGPYRIGGSCLGGTVAWEMATQLQHQGSVVDRVLVLDGRAPANGPGWQLVSRRAGTPLQKIAAALRHLKRGTLVRALRSIRRRGDRADVQASHERARVRYSAVPLDIDVLLIQSSEHAGEPEILDRWRSLGRSVQRDVLPNTQHTEALDDVDQLRQMAEIINARLSGSGE